MNSAMKLNLTLPSHWSLQTVGAELLALCPGADGKPELVMSYGPLVPIPDFEQAWVDATMGAALPRGARLDLQSSTIVKAEVGWPIRLVEGQVVSAEGGVLERRLGAFFRFFEYAGAALVRGSVSRFDAHRDDLLRALASARPDFRDERVVHLGQLFEDPERN